MNKESSNACLKIFEDTPKNIKFILIAENKDLVLDTIISRSTLLHFYPITNLNKLMAYEDLSPIELSLMNGCPGEFPTIRSLDTHEISLEILEFLKDFENKSYSEIIDFCQKFSDISLNILNNLFIIMAKELITVNGIDMSYILDSCKQFKEKIPLNINLHNHFKKMLIENKFKLSEIL